MKDKIMILLGVLLLLGACKMEKPSLPVWDVDLKIPLINEHFYVSELVDSVHIIVDEDNLLYLTTEGDVETNVLDPVVIEPNLCESSLTVLSGANPLQPIAFCDSLSDVILSYGEVASGEIKVRVADIDPDAGAWNLEFEILTITDAQGKPLHLSYTEATDWHSLDLSSYCIGIRDHEHPINELDVQLTSSSALPEGSALAKISFLITEPIRFHTFQGRFVHYEIQAASSASDIDIEYPHNLDAAVTLSEAFIEIAVSNQMYFSCEFVGWFQASRGDTVVAIPILDDDGKNYRIDAGTVGNPTHLVFSNRISELMQIMPDHIEIVDVKFIIDSASGYGTIQDTDTIYAHYTVLAPFRFILHDKPIIVDNPTRISISDENREQISKYVQEAALCLKVRNTVPVGATACAYFSDHETIDIADSTTYSFVKQMSIGSALTHPDWQDLDLMSLNRAELDLFSAPDVYLKWVFNFEKSDGLVEIHAGLADFIWIKGQILASLRLQDL